MKIKYLVLLLPAYFTFSLLFVSWNQALGNVLFCGSRDAIFGWLMLHLVGTIVSVLFAYFLLEKEF